MRCATWRQLPEEGGTAWAPFCLAKPDNLSVFTLTGEGGDGLGLGFGGDGGGLVGDGEGLGLGWDGDTPGEGGGGGGGCGGCTVKDNAGAAGV